MYNLKQSIIFLLLFSLFNLVVGFAQDTTLKVKEEGEILHLTLDEYTKVELPPLSVLFLNAKKSSNVEFFDARMQAQESMLKTEKKDWLKYFKIVAGIQYGVMSDNSSQVTQNVPQVTQLSSSSQYWYNVGFSVSIPFDDVFDRRNRVKRQRLEMKATKAEVARWYDEQKIRIIEAYTNSLLFFSVLKAKSEAMILANAQYKIAEMNFANGKIDASDLSALKSVESNAIVEYEQAKSDLSKALLQLEVLSNTEILNK